MVADIYYVTQALKDFSLSWTLIKQLSISTV